MSDNDSFYDIFFIFHPADIEKTRRIAAQLGASDTAIYFNEDEFGKTAEGVARLRDGALRSYAAAFVMSPDSAESQLCNELLQYAVSHGKQLVTLILDDRIDVEVHPSIAQNPYVFFRESDDLVARVNELRAYLRADHHLKLHTELLVLAEKWRARGRPAELLLPPGRLDEARGWLGAAAARHPKPSPLQIDYVHSSRRQPPRPGRMPLKPVALGIVAALALGACLLLLQQAVAGWQTAQRASELTRAAQTQLALGAAHATAASDSAIGLIDKVAATSAGLWLADARTATADAIAATAAAHATQSAVAQAETRAAQLRATEIAELERDEVGKRLVAAGEDALDGGEVELALALAWAAKDRLDNPRPAHRLLRRASVSRRSLTIEEVALLDIHPGGAGFAIVPRGRDAIHVYGGESWARQSSFREHEARVSTIMYNHAGAGLISASDDGEIIIRAGVSGEPARRLAAHRGAVTALALSPDGERLISAGSDPLLAAWDVTSGDELAAYRAEDEELVIQELVVSADGSRVIGFYEEDGRRLMRQWSADTLEPLAADSAGRVYRGFDAASGIAYSGGSSLPAFPGDSNTGDLVFWDMSTGARRAILADGFSWTFLSGDSLTTGRDELLFVAFFEDIALVAVNNSESGQRASLVASADGRLLRQFDGEIAARATSAAFIDRETILSATSDNRAVLWSSVDGGLISELGHASAPITQLDANPSANLAAARAVDGGATLWALHDGAAEALLTLEEALPGTRISPSGEAMLVFAEDGFRLRDIDRGEALMQGPAGAISVAEAGVASGNEGRIVVHDFETGAEIRGWEWTAGEITDLHLAPDGALLLVYSASNELWLARADADAPQRLADEMARPSLVRFAPGGDLIVTVHDELAWLWDGETGNARAGYPLGLPSGAALQAAFSADGDSLVFFVRLADGLAGLTRIDLARNEARRQTFIDVKAAALSVAGDNLSLAHGDGRIEVLSTADGASIHEFRADGGDILKLRYEPATRTLLSASGSDLLLWDAEAGTVDQRFAHAERVMDFSLSGDGRRVLTFDEDGHHRLWQVESADELLARVQARHQPRDLSCAERERYLVAPLCQ